MSILSGLISSAARGLQGGAEAVSALGKAGIEKNIKIDLAKETADIEFEKNKLLQELESDLRNKDADLQVGREQNLYHTKKGMDLIYDTDPQRLEFEKEKSKIITPLQQQQIDTSKSANSVQQFELKLLKENKLDLDNYLKEKKKPNPDPIKLKQLEDKITTIDKLKNVTQRARSMTDLVVNINRMFANDPNLINTEEGKKLMKDLPSMVREAARLSGYEGTIPSINTGGGNNDPLINGERSDVNKLLKAKPSLENFNILKNFTFKDDKTGRKYKLTDFDDKTDPPSYGQEFLDEDNDKQSSVIPSGRVAQAIAKGKENRERLIAESTDTSTVSGKNL